MIFCNFHKSFNFGKKFYNKSRFLNVNYKTLHLLNLNRKYSSSAEMESTPWREASSLIIASRLGQHDVTLKKRELTTLMNSRNCYDIERLNATDYRILLVKRSGSSSFMANAYVFPGGLVEVADYSPLWWPVFNKLGITRGELISFCSNIQGYRPPMITSPVTLKSQSALLNEDYLPSDISLRITAIRETFEETGILLLTNPSLETTQEATTHTLLSQNIDIKLWQKKVHDDPCSFLDLCLECHMCPDIWSLYEWSNWLTPTFESGRRYDTMFYLCCIPCLPDVLLDKGEITKKKWVTPDIMLTDYLKKSIFLAPPQIYELCRMIQLPSYHELKDFAKKRNSQGCEQWMPVVSTAEDGVLLLLPGDDLYPEEPDYEGTSKPDEYNHSFIESRKNSKNLHRFEMQGLQCTVYCSITPKGGHIQPVTYKPIQPIVKSGL